MPRSTSAPAATCHSSPPPRPVGGPRPTGTFALPRRRRRPAQCLGTTHTCTAIEEAVGAVPPLMGCSFLRLPRPRRTRKPFFVIDTPVRLRAQFLKRIQFVSNGARRYIPHRALSVSQLLHFGNRFGSFPTSFSFGISLSGRAADHPLFHHVVFAHREEERGTPRPRSHRRKRHRNECSIAARVAGDAR